MSILIPTKRDRQIEQTILERRKQERLGRRAYREGVRSGNYQAAMQAMDWVRQNGGSLGRGITKDGEEEANIRREFAWTDRLTGLANGTIRPRNSQEQRYADQNGLRGGGSVNPTTASQPGASGASTQPLNVSPSASTPANTETPQQRYVNGVRQSLFGDVSNFVSRLETKAGMGSYSSDTRPDPFSNEFLGESAPEGFSWVGYRNGQKLWERDNVDPAQNPNARAATPQEQSWAQRQMEMDGIVPRSRPRRPSIVVPPSNRLTAPEAKRRTFY